MDTKINFAVVHELIKEQHKAIQESNIRPNVLDITIPAVDKLIVGATSIYGRKNNTAHYGTFAAKTASDFPNDFSAYASLASHTEKSFLEITSSAMVELYDQAKLAHASSGGYILFIDYENAQGRFLMTSMLKKKDGLRLNENLVPEELIELDLSSLYHAARISFKRFAEYKNATESEKHELNYLSFLSQNAGRSAAGYFVTALGCALGTASSTATKNLIIESAKFFRDRPDLKKHRLAVKDDILRYLEKQKDAQESAKLSEIEHIARAYFPASYDGQADDLADEFTSYLNSEAVGVPVEFPVNKSVLDKHTHIFYKSENWQLKFDRDALGTGIGAEIRFIKESNQLVINNLPTDVITLIQEALADRTEPADSAQK
ncbi:nucleoid-associated protein [Pseudomonas sp. LjRoot263]|uniref:nucleoid-associated protein n=1 Tax=Pseudomonas sp. LjRoot263 TaxID=3342302 RepID=UPI003ED0241F